MREYQVAANSQGRVVSEIVVPHPPNEEEEIDIDEAVLSPSLRWLAVSSRPYSGAPLLQVIDLKGKREVLRTVRSGYGGWRWFRWMYGDRLAVNRSKARGTGGATTDVDYFSPPAWTPTKADPADRVTEQLFSLTLAPQVRKLQQQASAILDERGYIVPSRPAPGGTPAIFWGSYFDDGSRSDSAAAISRNGDIIAAYGARFDFSKSTFGKLVHDEQLVLLRKQTGWREERLPQPRELFQLRFWKNWLVVGDGNLIPEPKHQPGWPQSYRMVSSRFKLYDVENLQRVLTIPADYVVLDDL